MEHVAKWSLSGVLLAGLLAVTSPAANAQSPVTLELYNPTGAIEVVETFAPRVDDLNGKTICELSNASWEADRMLALIRSRLQEQYPTSTFIAYDQFPQGNVSETGIDNDKAVAMVLEKGCDAVIVGNAG